MDWSYIMILCPWNSPGKNTGVGGYSLLQGVIPTLVSNRGLLDYRQNLYPLSHSASKVCWQNDVSDFQYTV